VTSCYLTDSVLTCVKTYDEDDGELTEQHRVQTAYDHTGYDKILLHLETAKE